MTDDDRHGWNHQLCTHCWMRQSYDKWGELRAPVRVRDADLGTCCRCAHFTYSGIFVRIKPGDRSIENCPDLVDGDDRTS